MAKLKNTTLAGTDSLDIAKGSTAQRPALPLAGMIRYNTTLNEAEYYDGANWRFITDSNPEATGGTVVDTTINGIDYRIHLFTTTGNSTFTVSKGGEIEYLIVAGGGGGSNRHKGGGGAGGVIQGATTVTPQAYTITVGAGGNGVAQTVLPTTGSGTNGSNSTAFGLTAIGGGIDGAIGGSGGGGGAGGAGAAGTTDQGNSGGSGSYTSGGFINETSYCGGGGGGAGSIGTNALSVTPCVSGNGGQGISSEIMGTVKFYAGGGGGGGATGSRGGLGGLGGGGEGGPFGVKLEGGNGHANTGSGGGSGAFAGGTNYASGAGGSGIVIVRYRKNKSSTATPNRRTISNLPNTSENWLISELRRFTPTNNTPRVLIHAESEGLNNINGFNLTRVDIDGTTFINATTPRSLRITQLRRNGVNWQYVESRTYDAFGDVNQANAALAYLRTFQTGDLLILTTYDHLQNHSILNSELQQSFFSNAGITFTVNSARDSHLLIAEKNKKLYYENYKLQGIPGIVVSMILE
jgi:hypothetical protein